MEAVSSYDRNNIKRNAAALPYDPGADYAALLRETCREETRPGRRAREFLSLTITSAIWRRRRHDAPDEGHY